jgi:hypothetical protein
MKPHHLTLSAAALSLLLFACQPTGDGQGEGGLDDDLGPDLIDDVRPADAQDTEITDDMRHADAQDTEITDDMRHADVQDTEITDDMRHADVQDTESIDDVPPAEDLAPDLLPDLPPDEESGPDLACNLTCPAPDPRCDGEVAVTYAGDGEVTEGCACDYEGVRVREDCAQAALRCEEGRCVGAPDPCEGVSCPPPPPSCEGDVAVRALGDGICDPDDGRCGYAAVTAREDCAATGRRCGDGACLAPQDPCLGVSCPALADFCQGDVAVRFLRGGVCAAGDCDYSGATAQEDCAARGARCVGGACSSTPARPPRRGELFVVEVMRNPEAVADDQGEWFELYNSADAPLQLGGLLWTDENSNRFTIPASPGLIIPAGGRLVLGNNPDRLTNGGVALDYAYTDSNFVLANGADRIVLLDGEVELARLDWTTDWPAPTGASIQLDALAPLSALADAASWCPSRALLPDGDRGTPGLPNQPCALPVRLTTAQALGDEGAPGRPEVFTPVRVEGLVVTAAATEGQRRYVWAQDPAGGPHSGLRLDLTGSGIQTPARGALISVEGLYEEFFTVAQVRVERLTAQGVAALPAPHLTTPAALTNLAEAERWENALVRFVDLTVTDANPDAPEDFGEFVVNGAARVDDMIYRLPARPLVGARFSALIGIWSHSFDNYKLEPRGADDVSQP